MPNTPSVGANGTFWGAYGGRAGGNYAVGGGNYGGSHGGGVSYGGTGGTGGAGGGGASYSSFTLRLLLSYDEHGYIELPTAGPETLKAILPGPLTRKPKHPTGPSEWYWHHAKEGVYVSMPMPSNQMITRLILDFSMGTYKEVQHGVAVADKRLLILIEKAIRDGNMYYRIGTDSYVPVTQRY